MIINNRKNIRVRTIAVNERNTELGRNHGATVANLGHRNHQCNDKRDLKRRRSHRHIVASADVVNVGGNGSVRSNTILLHLIQQRSASKKVAIREEKREYQRDEVSFGEEARRGGDAIGNGHLLHLTLHADFDERVDSFVSHLLPMHHFRETWLDHALAYEKVVEGWSRRIYKEKLGPLYEKTSLPMVKVVSMFLYLQL